MRSGRCRDPNEFRVTPAVPARDDSFGSLTWTSRTGEEAAAEEAILKRGTFDPKVITEGTMAYLFTFDNGLRLIFRDSAGPITDAERSAMQRIGKTDVAIVGYIGQYVAKRQIAATLPIIQLYNPRLYLPGHHDEIAGTFVDIGVEPLFMAVRDQMPDTRWVSPLYREPVCVRLGKPQRKNCVDESLHRKSRCGANTPATMGLAI